MTWTALQNDRQGTINFNHLVSSKFIKEDLLPTGAWKAQDCWHPEGNGLTTGNTQKKRRVGFGVVEIRFCSTPSHSLHLFIYRYWHSLSSFNRFLFQESNEWSSKVFLDNRGLCHRPLAVQNYISFWPWCSIPWSCSAWHQALADRTGARTTIVIKQLHHYETNCSFREMQNGEHVFARCFKSPRIRSAELVYNSFCVRSLQNSALYPGMKPKTQGVQCGPWPEGQISTSTVLL